MKSIIISILPYLRTYHSSVQGQATWIVGCLLCVWIWIGTPPALVNIQATQTAIESIENELATHRSAREKAVEATLILDGPRGDFEKRGIALSSVPPQQQQAQAAELAADIRVWEAAARAAEAERTTLKRYDELLMARTRALGPRAEQLRAATWPIVEHLKLYPPPWGQRVDWHAPASDFFATRALSLEQGLHPEQAAIEAGRSTYALKQLLALDTVYATELQRYAQQLTTVVQQSGASPALIQYVLTALLSFSILCIFMTALALYTTTTPSWTIIAAIVTLAGWWISSNLVGALMAGIGLIMLISYAPGLAALLPLLSIPMYYRPRSLGPWNFPVSETLIGLISVGIITGVIWRKHHGVALDWKPSRMIIYAAGGLAIAAAISFLSPLLVAERPALRELRRMIIEPSLWAILVSMLINQQRIRPHQLVWTFIFSTAWIAGDGLIRAGLGSGIWATGTVPRLTGLLPSSTAFGVYVGAGCAAALSIAITASTRRFQLAAWCLVPILATATLLSFTRGAWLGLAGVLLAVLIHQKRWKWLSWGIGLASATVVGLLLQPAWAVRILRLDEATETARLLIWKSSLQVIQTAPMTGAGLDQFAYLDAQRFGIPQIRFLTLSHPHNLLLDLWIQLGFTGICLVVCFIGCSGYWLWKARQHVSAYATAMILLQLCIHGMVDQTMSGGDLWYVWWMIGIIAGTYKEYLYE